MNKLNNDELNKLDSEYDKGDYYDPLEADEEDIVFQQMIEDVLDVICLNCNCRIEHCICDFCEPEITD